MKVMNLIKHIVVVELFLSLQLFQTLITSSYFNKNRARDGVPPSSTCYVFFLSVTFDIDEFVSSR